MDQVTPRDVEPRLRGLLDLIAAGTPVREPGLDLAHVDASGTALAAGGTAPALSLIHI